MTTTPPAQQAIQQAGKSLQRPVNAFIRRCIRTYVKRRYRQGDLPARGEPNSVDVVDYGNGEGQIREYGPDGRASKDFDFGHDHNGAGTHTPTIGIGRNQDLEGWDGPSTQENDSMVSCYYGFVPGERARQVLIDLMPFLQPDWSAIIRSIDSSRSLDDLDKILNFHHILHDAVSENVCLSMSGLKSALDGGVFTGFDEVWIVAGAPPAFALAQTPAATSDATEFSEGLPDGLMQTMESQIAS